MKKTDLLFVVLLSVMNVFFGCNNPSAKNRIIGKWQSKDGKTKLKITPKNFTLDEGDGPIAENYFVKGDTLFTSYEGSQPYTKFVVKDLADKSFTLVYPDSTLVEFIR